MVKIKNGENMIKKRLLILLISAMIIGVFSNSFCMEERKSKVPHSKVEESNRPTKQQKICEEQNLNEGDEEGPFSWLTTNIPEIALILVEQGIKSELNSDLDPVKAVTNAFRYLYSITSTNQFWRSHKDQLKEKLKKWSIEKFAPEYSELTESDLNEKLKNVMLELRKQFGKLLTNQDEAELKIAANESPERNEIVKLVIAGADPNFVNVIADAKEAKGTLSSSAAPTNLYAPKDLLLAMMIKFEDVNLIRLLIAYGVDVNRKINYIAPLDLAISGNLEKAVEIVNLLIKAGADVNNTKDGLNTAVKRAVYLRQAPILEVLIKNGAKLNDADIAYIISSRNRPGYGLIYNILVENGYKNLPLPD